MVCIVVSWSLNMNSIGSVAGRLAGHHHHHFWELVDPELVESEVVDPELVDPELVDPELVDPELVVPELVDQELVDREPHIGSNIFSALRADRLVKIDEKRI